MKKFSKLCPIVAMLLVGSMFMGCHSDLDFTNIDPSSEVKFGLALPVCTLKVSVGDMFGDSSMFYVDSMENKGVLTWKDTFSVSRNYHQMDLSQYISSVDMNLNVYDKLMENPALAAMITYTGKVTTLADPISLTINFPLDVPLTGINDVDKTFKERLDSALIEMASFASTITTKNLPMQWNWIDTVVLSLGEQVTRPAGNEMIVYDKARDPYTDFGQKITTNVDNFSLVMMKNRHPAIWSDYANNVYDTCRFNVAFRFTIPPYTTISVPSDASFAYHMDVQFIDYTAIWGMFEPSKDMSEKNVFDLGKNWGDLEFILKSKLPFSEPRIDVDIKTSVAGALVIKDAYLFALNANSADTVWAEFGDSRARKHDFHFNSSQYLRLDSKIGEETKNMKLHFNNTPEGGRIDAMFRTIPDKFGYCFATSFDQMETPQIRILPSTSIKVTAECNLPLVLANGVYVNYSDTMRDVNISQLSIDSLVNQVQAIDSIKQSDVKLIVTAKNTIPLSAKASIRCLDENGNIIKDPIDPTKDFLLVPEDTFRIEAPKYVYTNGSWGPAPGGEGTTTLIVSLSQEQMNVFPKIKQIRYGAIIDDNDLQQAYKDGLTGVKITVDEGISFIISLTAQLDAFLNMSKTSTNNQ